MKISLSEKDKDLLREKNPKLNNNIQETVSVLVKRLKEEGFILQKLDAVTTNSVYIKLDYGVGNSIRISDHEGKKYLKYRYNVLTNVNKEYECFQDGFARYYFPPDKIENLIKMAVDKRDFMLDKYGKTSYELFMERNQEQNKESKGFWQTARKI